MIHGARTGVKTLPSPYGKVVTPPGGRARGPGPPPHPTEHPIPPLTSLPAPPPPPEKCASRDATRPRSEGPAAQAAVREPGKASGANEAEVREPDVREPDARRQRGPSDSEPEANEAEVREPEAEQTPAGGQQAETRGRNRKSGLARPWPGRTCGSGGGARPRWRLERYSVALLGR